MVGEVQQQCGVSGEAPDRRLFEVVPRWCSQNQVGEFVGGGLLSWPAFELKLSPVCAGKEP